MLSLGRGMLAMVWAPDGAMGEICRLWRFPCVPSFPPLELVLRSCWDFLRFSSGQNKRRGVVP